jgi:hypothetical protein
MPYDPALRRNHRRAPRTKGQARENRQETLLHRVIFAQIVALAEAITFIL